MENAGKHQLESDWVALESTDHHVNFEFLVSDQRTLENSNLAVIG